MSDVDAADREAVMTLTEHLAELRVRIIRAGLAVLLGMVLIVALYDQVVDFLLQPYVDLCARKAADFCDPNLIITSPTEGVRTRLRVGMYGGLILALPVILWQVWRFAVPALKKNEKRYAIPFVLTAALLFFAGASLAYYSVGRALEFLIGWSGSSVDELFTVSSYISLVGLMMFAFGIGFLLPVILVFLQLVGVVRPRQLIAGWRYAIVGLFVLAAVITPSGDPPTLLTLAIPLVLLYFLSAFVGWLLTRGSRSQTRDLASSERS